MKREETQVAVVGGKAAALGRMLDAGFPVPAFFVCPDGVPDDLSEKLASLGGNCFAVRSSAVSEDSAAQSYAGQFESFLFVSADEVAERISDVERSGEASRLEHYAGSASERPRVVIQKMIDAVESGVAFSADPVTGDRDTVVVSRTSGTAEKLVSGEIDGETMRFRKGVGAEADPQSSDVVELVARCESLFGTPQDVEWCRDQDGKLWVVQSRPITAMPPIRRIWDNSNIAESYGGIVSPLTFSFARRVYAEVYRQFCRVMGVPESSISRQPQIFDDLLDRIEGRVYYDLGNWYRVLALLPGFSFNREFMEQMMGVKKSLPAEFSDRIAGEAKRGRWRDGLALLSSVCGLVRQAARIDNTRSAFQHRLDQALDADLTYEELEEQLLKKWDAPLINDFLAMIAFGVLRKLCAKWADDADPNALVAGAGDEIISLEPARRIQAMAQLAAERKSYRSEWEQYLEKFGDRCLEELKLESPTLHDDDTPLLAAVEGMAAVIKERGRNQNEGAASSTQSTPAVAVKGWLRRRVFAWVLRQTRNRVRDRENLRFERTRLFGQVRRIMVEKGRHWHEEGRISQPDDVFYLTIEEILHDDISPKRIESRRLETERFLQNEPPPDRIESISDDPTWTEKPARSLDSATEKSGTACCPGRVRGQVRVVIDPRDADIRPGEILVARQTDPGWVMLFPAASGLLVERGSMLSHSAIVSREMGLPSIVGLSGVCDWLETGDEVEMDGSEGWVKLVKRSSSEATGSTPES